MINFSQLFEKFLRFAGKCIGRDCTACISEQGFRFPLAYITADIQITISCWRFELWYEPRNNRSYSYWRIEDIFDQDVAGIRKPTLENRITSSRIADRFFPKFLHKLRRCRNTHFEDIAKNFKDTTEKGCVAQSVIFIEICGRFHPLQKLPHSTIRLRERCKGSASPPHWLPMALTKASHRIIFSEIQHQDKTFLSEFYHEPRFPSSG